VGVGSAVGCGSSTGCPNGYEVAMGMCVPAGSTQPNDAAMAGDAGMQVAEDDATIFVDDAAMAMELSDAGVLELPDAAMAPDTGCLLPTLFADVDGDGFGDPSAPLGACEASHEGYVLDATDCNDACASCHPGGTETCNGVDDDCDGSVDDGVLLSFYRDADGDGFGTGAAVMACSAPAGHSAMAGDCNDSCASCRPGGTETCNGTDDDCDGSVDEGVTTTFYLDADGDTYGRTDRPTQACTQPAGHAARGGDCDDASSTASPGATEICDGRDNDCDGGNDEGVTITYYRDADGDSYGRADMTTQACSAPSGYVGTAGDCNDGSAAIRPSAAETCNDVDDDCDGAIDDGLSRVTYYVDCDGDGVAAEAESMVACRVPTTAPTTCSGGAWRAGRPAAFDCLDTNANVYPGRTMGSTSPIPGAPLGAARNFDYNCSGANERLLLQLAVCGGGLTASGWAGTTAPECNQSALWRTCTGGSSSTTSTVWQSCI
jgi:hypothetical protein